MGVSYITDESIFDLLQGLPDGIEWEIFHKFTMNKLSLNLTSSTLVSSSTTASMSPPSSFTFTNASKLLLEKANAIVGCCKLAGLGLEYVNVAVKLGKTNPSTGVWIHKNNPSSVHCTNPPCNGKSQAETVKTGSTPELSLEHPEISVRWDLASATQRGVLCPCQVFVPDFKM